MQTPVKPAIASIAGRGGRAVPRISQRIIAGTIALALMMAGCSTRSHEIRAGRSAPASDPWAAFTSNPQVAQIIASSCFDCHSENGAAAWYVRMSPSYWFSGSARRDLNFTEWKDYDATRRNEAIAAIGRVVNRGEMPPWDYTVFHPAAELSNEQKDLVTEWAARQSEALPAH